MTDGNKANANNSNKSEGAISSASMEGFPEINDSTSPSFQRTIGSMMGEIVWLMTQSPIHRKLSLADLEWLVMPPIVLGQYKLFRDENQKPIGVALWGYLNEQAEKKLKKVGKLAPQDWGNNAALDAAAGLVRREGGTLWLIELIAPFHTDDNQHRQRMIADVTGTSLKGQHIKLLHLSPESGKREEIIVGKNPS